MGEKIPSDCSPSAFPALWACLVKRLRFSSQGLKDFQLLKWPAWQGVVRDDSSLKDVSSAVRRKLPVSFDMAGEEMPTACSCRGQPSLLEWVEVVADINLPGGGLKVWAHRCFRMFRFNPGSWQGSGQEEEKQNLHLSFYVSGISSLPLANQNVSRKCGASDKGISAWTFYKILFYFIFCCVGEWFECGEPLDHRPLTFLEPFWFYHC